jgi:dimethylamine/trimethylamine dehydrogenase
MDAYPNFNILFEPVKIGPKVAKNRFYQVPHCNGMAYVLPKTHAAMREVQAEGGWGVVCTEYCSIHPTSDDSPFPFAALWDDDDIKTYSLMVEKVHQHGALAGAQLWYGGAAASNLMSREVAIDVDSYPSTLKPDPVQCRAMDKKDIRDLRRWQVTAAKRALQAGFDIVYVYATHDYLLSHFLSREWNRRCDEYGGSLENRVRLVREMIADTKDAVGDRCAVAVRFSADGSGSGNGIIDNSEQREMLEMLSELPDLWDINITDYSKEMGSSRYIKEAAQEDYISYVKKITDKPVVGVGRFTSPESMLRQVKKGWLDFVGAARPSISDPFLPVKIKEGRLDDIRECIGCNICYAHNSKCVPSRCTQNPTMGEEWRRNWHPERIPAKTSHDKILVVGAGPAGLEAARALGQRRYAVTLADAATELGGRVIAESRLPGLSEWRRVVDYRIQQLKRLSNVDIYFSSRLTFEDIIGFDFERIILATGSSWRRDGLGRWHSQPVETFNAKEIYSPDDIMNDVDIRGPVVVYDDDHYYMGPVLAEKLQQMGNDVTLVTPSGYVSEWGKYTEEHDRTQRRILEIGITILTGKIVSGFQDGSVEVTCIYTGKCIQLPASSIVTVTARKANDDLYHQLMAQPDIMKEKGIKSATRIGDCLAPGTIAAAIYSGHRAAREMDATRHERLSFLRERISV